MSKNTLFESSISEINSSLGEKCEVMAKLISKHEIAALKPKVDHFQSLTEAILSQQLSVKAAATIFKRFEEMLNLRIDPQSVLSAEIEDLRSCGISGQKSKYLKDLAFHFQTYPTEYEALEKLDDEIVIERLVRIKGIGLWSAQMFLMFSLGRLDIFPVDDLGIRNAMYKHYFEGKEVPKNVLTEFSTRWSPYRTMACLYLWRSLNDK